MVVDSYLIEVEIVGLPLLLFPATFILVTLAHIFFIFFVTVVSKNCLLLQTKAKYKGQMMSLRAELLFSQQRQLQQQQQQQQQLMQQQQRQQQRQQQSQCNDVSMDGKHVLVQRATAEQRPHEKAQSMSVVATECPQEGSVVGHRSGEDVKMVDDSA